jgi:hypothetical protein
MSQTIRATPRSASFSSSRIDLVPSRRAAMAWLAWLALVCAVTSWTVDLPASIRMVLCVLVATPGIRAVRSFVMLGGARGVRAIEWTGSTLILRVGPERRPLAATWGTGSFRPARDWLALSFDTPAGRRRVLVDGRYQDARAFKRLCREYSRGLKGGSRRDSRTS